MAERAASGIVDPTPAEKDLIAAARQGHECECSGDDSPPPEAGIEDGRTIRAEVLRDLLVGVGSGVVHERGVALRGARIVGVLDLEQTSARPLSLANCRILERPNLICATIKGLRLSGCITPGLDADHLECKGSFRLDANSLSTGPVSMAWATVTGDVTFEGTFTGDEAGPAINAQGLDCRAGLFLKPGLVANGEVRLVRAKVGAALVCAGVTLRNRGAFCINAPGLRCLGSINLSAGFSAEGEVSFARSVIEGQLTCKAGEFRNPDGYALNLEGMACAGDVFLDDGFRATGEVTLAGCRVSGQVSCDAGVFANPRGMALNAQGLECKGDVFLRSGFEASGEVTLAGSNVTGQVSCTGGALVGSLVLSGARLGGQLIWSEIRCSSSSTLELDGANVAVLVIDKGCLPQRLTLNGLTYGAIEPLGDLPLQLEWLAAAQFDSQPYHELARVLKLHGHREAATSVLVEGERGRLRNRAARSRWRRAFDKALEWLFAATVGYGYKPSRALLWLLGIWAVGSVAFSIGAHYHSMLPAREAVAVTAQVVAKAAPFETLDAILYSLDTMLPVIDLGVADQWRPSRLDTRLWLYLRVHVALGWIFSTLAVLGFTGVVRRRD